MTDSADQITFEDFTKVKLRVGRVVEAANHPNADKLLVLQVDLGDEKRQLCAGLKGHYEPEELVGKSIVVVVNLAPRAMRGETSEGMLLAASTEGHAQIVLLTVDKQVPPGSPVS